MPVTAIELTCESGTMCPAQNVAVPVCERMVLRLADDSLCRTVLCSVVWSSMERAKRCVHVLALTATIMFYLSEGEKLLRTSAEAEGRNTVSPQWSEKWRSPSTVLGYNR